MFPVVTTQDGYLKTQLFFLRLGLLSTLIRLENGALRKRSSSRMNLKMPA